MKASFRKLTVSLSILLLTACIAPVKQVSNSGKPDWIDNPGNGVSAAAGTHVRGKVAQEGLAILRAREEYAKRFGVNIQSVQMSSTTVANGHASTVAAQSAREEMQQNDVKAMVKAKWRDPDSDVLWVWLIPSSQ